MNRLGILTTILLLSAFFFLIPSFVWAGEKPAKSLHGAANDGDIQQVKSLISAGADVNAEDMAGLTPLFYAVDSGHKQVAELLIAAGANVNAKERQGNTPLHFAALRGHYEVCELLIAKGADPGARNVMGGTPLAMAQAGRHSQVVQLLSTHRPEGQTFVRTRDRTSRFTGRPEAYDLYPGYEDSENGTKVRLRQKFLPGTYEMVQTSLQNNVTQMNNQTLPIQTSNTFWFEIDASRPDRSGQVTCTITVKRVKQSGATGSFDTDDPESLRSDQVGQYLSSMLEGEFVLKFGPDWQLISASGLDRIWQDIGREAPAATQMTQEIKETIDQKSFAKWMFGLAYDIMPDQPVGVGDVWHKATSARHLLLSTIEGNTECKLTKIEQTYEGKIAYITFTSHIESDKTTSTKIGPVSVTVKSAKMKQTGQIQLNVDTGLMLEQNMTTTGDLEMSGKDKDGKEVAVTMKFNETAVTTTKLIAGGYGTLRPRYGSYAQAQRSSQADPLADPNEIKARIKTFEGLEKALEQIDSKSRLEKGAWLQSKIDNRTALARAVQERLRRELTFVRKIAVEEKAEKTTKTIDDVLAKRQQLYSKIRRELLVQKKELKQAQSFRGRSRGRYPGRTARRRYPPARYSPGQPPIEDMAGPYTQRGGLIPRTYGFRGERYGQQQVNTETENKINEWLQTTIDNKANLLNSVHTEIWNEYIFIRMVAVEEEAKKTTAAIDGLLLSRQAWFDELSWRMDLQQMRDPRGRYRGRYPSQSRRYPQGSHAAGQEQFMDRRPPLPGQR